MAQEKNHGTVVVGPHRYDVGTDLDLATWERIHSIVEGALAETDPKASPDRRLLLACLNLVFSFDGHCQRLESLIEEYGEEEKE
ncbi:MAG: hypothetical protein CSA35_08350 [Dethiosulfovibrio peptidovorans]|nr:MAG: hypothetical protein CSA35_08350 [Dethiosulfovibrio peptidovorans]